MSRLSGGSLTLLSRLSGGPLTRPCRLSGGPLTRLSRRLLQQRQLTGSALVVSPPVLAALKNGDPVVALGKNSSLIYLGQVLYWLMIMEIYLLMTSMFFVVVRVWSQHGLGKMERGWEERICQGWFYCILGFVLFSLIQRLKGTVLRDRFRKCWRKLTDLGLNKDRGWFLNFSEAPLIFGWNKTSSFR